MQVHDEKHYVEAKACVWKNTRYFWFYKFLALVAPFAVQEVFDTFSRINYADGHHKTFSNAHSFASKTRVAMWTLIYFKGLFFIEVNGRLSPITFMTRFCPNWITR